MKSWIFIG